jgi:uncharacterized membrane protein
MSKKNWTSILIDTGSSKIKNKMKAHKKYTAFCFAMLVFFVAVFLVVSQNYSWYDATIVKILHEETSFDHIESGGHGETETYYKQTLTGMIKNGSLKGKEIKINNVFSSSGVYDDEYKAGDEVFVKIKDENQQQLTGSISGLKRDKYLSILVALLFLLIAVAAGRKGLLTMLSLMINIVVFWFALDRYADGINILALSNGLVIFFSSISLLLVSGFQRKTFSAIFSAILTVWITMALFQVSMSVTDGVDYAFMEYLVNPNDLYEIFMSQILLGGLGAIMDVSITMSSTISELISRDPKISYRSLLQSGREVGHDIMGTMINVLLFTYLSGSIPLIILKMKNDVRLFTIVSQHMPMEWYRFLIGSIGILLCIPISLFVAMILFRRTTSWRNWRFSR